MRRIVGTVLAAFLSATLFTGPATAVPSGDSGNELVTGVLGDVRLSTGKQKALTYRFKKAAVFSDRPKRSAKTLDPDTLAGRQWRRTFAASRPVVQLAVAGSDALVTAKLGRPERIGRHRFRSRISFSGRELRPKAIRGRDLTFFATSRATEAQDSSCIDLDGRIPNDADFIGELGRTTLTGHRGDKFLRLQSRQPRALHWFLSGGAGCERQFTGPLPFEKLTRKSDWLQLFGRIKPNSALVWETRRGSRSLEFEQGRPRWNPATGRWVSKVIPLGEGGESAKKRVRQFIAQHGRRTAIRSGQLFMDSTNSVNDGGEVWVVDPNFRITYSVQDSNLQIQFVLKNSMTGWMGVGFSEFMFPGDNIVVWMDEGEPVAWDAYNPGIPELASFPAPLQDTDPVLRGSYGPLSNRDNVQILSSTVSGGVTTITVQRPLVTGDIFDYEFRIGQSLHVVAAYSERLGFVDEYDSMQPMHSNAGAGVWML